MSRLSTKNIPQGGVNKMIQPGDIIAKINSVVLEKTPFKDKPEDPESYNVVFNIEGPDLGDSFEGFFIDKEDQSKGRHKGAIGRVRSDKWPFKNGVTKSGIEIFRDIEILKFMKNVCRELDLMDWFDKEDNQHETIESLVEKFNNDGLFKDKWLKMCIAGKEYVNKGGFTNFELSFPKFTQNSVPFELESVKPSKSKIISFDHSVHMDKKKVKEVEVIKEFGDEPKPETTTKKIRTSDFEL